MKKNYKENDLIAHRNHGENAHVTSTGIVTGFDGVAIRIRNDNGQTYLINRWDVVKYPKLTKAS